MSNGIASPRREVWEYVTSDSTAWLCLFGLATFGSYDRVANPRLYPAKATLAARLGVVSTDGAPKVTTIKHPLARLVKAGVIASAKPKRGWHVLLPRLEWDDDERPPASPPDWLLELDLPSHLKRCLIGVRSFAEFADDADVATVDCTIEEVAKRTGQKWKATYAQFRELESRGFVTRGNGAILVSRLPSPGAVPHVGTANAAPCESTTTTADSATRENKVTSDGEQTLLLPCSDLAKTLGGTEAQVTLFGEAEPPPKPKRRDLVAEVIEYFNARVADARTQAKRRASTGVTMTKTRRKQIQACLDDVDGDAEVKLTACKRVIDVQIAQVFSPRPEDRERDWGHLDTEFLFSKRMFNKFLGRWRENGDHVLWWQAKTRPSGIQNSVGRNEEIRQYVEDARAGKVETFGRIV